MAPMPAEPVEALLFPPPRFNRIMLAGANEPGEC